MHDHVLCKERGPLLRFAKKNGTNTYLAHSVKQNKFEESFKSAADVKGLQRDLDRFELVSMHPSLFNCKFFCTVECGAVRCCRWRWRRRCYHLFVFEHNQMTIMMLEFVRFCSWRSGFVYVVTNYHLYHQHWIHAEFTPRRRCRCRKQSDDDGADKRCYH